MLVCDVVTTLSLTTVITSRAARILLLRTVLLFLAA